MTSHGFGRAGSNPVLDVIFLVFLWFPTVRAWTLGGYALVHRFYAGGGSTN
jgi:hypothetical protein